jgi:hypothetical protein
MSGTDSIELPPYVGVKDREALAKLRLKRWKARAWMRSHGIRELGSRLYPAQKITGGSHA